MTKNNINLISVIPIRSYLNIGTRKKQICMDNIRKTGIYRLTHIISGKSYVGSSINLSIRFRDYLNINYLKREINIFLMFILALQLFYKFYITDKP
jgi:hypothetical protein